METTHWKPTLFFWRKFCIVWSLQGLGARVKSFGGLVCGRCGLQLVRSRVLLNMLVSECVASGSSNFTPTVATSELAASYALGRVLRCHLPVAGGRIIHLVFFYGFQGASTDSEKLRLAGKLLDSVLCELAVVAPGHPCLIVGDLNVDPDKVPCLLKSTMAEILERNTRPETLPDDTGIETEMT